MRELDSRRALLEREVDTSEGTIPLRSAPEDNMARWQRQMQTPYVNLPEEEKESDRAEARRIVRVVAGWLVELSGPLEDQHG